MSTEREAAVNMLEDRSLLGMLDLSTLISNILKKLRNHSSLRTFF